MCVCVCAQASKERKAFQLDIPLRGEIDPSESSWKPGVGGRITLTLKKGPYGPSKKLASRWPNLFATKYKHKGVVQQWWDRAEEYKAALDALSDDDDDEEGAATSADAKSEESNTAKGGKGGNKDAEDDDDADDEEEEDKEERALAKKKRQEKAKAQAAKVEAKKKAKEEAKAAKLKEAAEKDAAAKANSGEGVAGFLGEALRAIAAEEAAELEAAEAAHKAKKAEIVSTRDAQLKTINEELAAETARLRADADAKRAALQANEEGNGAGGGDDSGDVNTASGVASAEAAGWRAAAAALESKGPVLHVASPGAWAGKEATHAPRVVLGPSSGDASSATVTVSVSHAAASPGHWVEFMWARALGADHNDLGVVAAQRFPAAEEISAKGLITSTGATQLELSVSALPIGTAFVTGYAYCNLHGVWRSEPVVIDRASLAAGSSAAGEL
jgi:desulfoferrodoxin (superoxide reductase-like protein)